MMPVSLRYCLSHWNGNKKCGNMVSSLDRYCNECRVSASLERLQKQLEESE